MAGTTDAQLGLGYVGALDIHRDARTDGTAYFELARRLHFQQGVEGHLVLTTPVFCKYTLERLLKEGRSERIAHHQMPSRLVGTRLHLHKARLVQGAGVDINGMAVGAGPAGQSFVVLGGLLHELGVILVDVMVRPDRLLQVVVDHHAGTLRASATGEEHDPSASVGESALQQADSDGKGGSSGSKWSFALRDGPRVALQLAEQIRQVHVALLDGLKETT